MGKVLTIFGGAAAIALGFWGIASWWYSFVELLKGTVPCFLILGGLIAFFAGVSELKDEKAMEKSASPAGREEKKA